MKTFLKRKLLLFVLPLIVFVALPACQDDLDVTNPNEPTLDVLDTEDGLRRSMLGVYNVFDNLGYIWLALTHHEIMGDALYVPWGNFGWRWSNQPTSITLDDGTVVTPPQGGSQAQELSLRNDRAQGDDNAFIHEWSDMYQINNIGNLLLQKLDGGTIQLSGDAETKAATIAAFARFWKGFAYSRIGSMYSAGVLTEEFGETNANFVNQSAVIDAANDQFDQAIALLNDIDNEEIYYLFMESGIPDYMRPNGAPSPQTLIRTCNTMKARNLLVNTRVADMTDAEWNEILTLSQAGLQQEDTDYLLFATADENAAFAATAWVPYRVLIGWAFPSERLIQDFQDGDERFDRNFVELATPNVNMRGRGIQYGTRYGFKSIEDGGNYASVTEGLATIDIAGSWEETSLMAAEALIMTNSVDEGLALIDEVRAAQNAGLEDIADDGLSMDDAYEQLRSERRIGLLLRGLAFYDARRWGILDPVSEGGGRTDAVVLDGSGNVNTDATINYNYLSYWGVPDGELDFNPPADGSASVDPI